MTIAALSEKAIPNEEYDADSKTANTIKVIEYIIRP